MTADWAAIEANEIRLWIGDPEPLWCPTCALPSGYRAPIQRDPADPPVSWAYGCTENDDHRRSVADHHQPPVDCDGCVCGCPSCEHVCGIEDEDS